MLKVAKPWLSSKCNLQLENNYLVRYFGEFSALETIIKIRINRIETFD